MSIHRYRILIGEMLSNLYSLNYLTNLSYLTAQTLNLQMEIHDHKECIIFNCQNI